MKKNFIGIAAATLGQIGGSITSERKAETSRQNGLDQRPHIVKTRHFESIFPHVLYYNESRDRFPVGKTPKGRVATYNPDYYCPQLRSYIECATSIPNISEQGKKWKEALGRGLNLHVYWWEGEEITNRFLPRPKNISTLEAIGFKSAPRVCSTLPPSSNINSALESLGFIRMNTGQNFPTVRLTKKQKG